MARPVAGIIPSWGDDVASPIAGFFSSQVDDMASPVSGFLLRTAADVTFFSKPHSLYALFAEMGSPVRLPMAHKNLPSIYGSEPLPFLYGEGEVNLDREFVRGCPLSGYSYFVVPTLNTHTHPSKWVEE